MVRKPTFAYFRLVGKNADLLRITFDVDIGGTVLLNLSYIEELKAGKDNVWSKIAPNRPGYQRVERQSPQG